MGSEDSTVADTPGSGAARKLTVDLPARYLVLEVLGSGGMGKVIRAHDATLGRDVAIKVVEQDLKGPDQTIQRERFVREARAAARLIHPNIVAIHDVDPEAGWLVMDLVEGESLRDVAERGPMPPAQVKAIAAQLLSALAAAHAGSVIHRDLKPANIVIGRTGKVTLIDFGIARVADAEMTRTGESLGTPAYMAPEQIRGAPVDGRTDLYGLAATLFELVTGTRVVAFETMTAGAAGRLATACASDPALAEVIARCLQGDPDARYPSAAAALVRLEGKQPGRGLPWRRIIAGLVIVAAIGAIAFGAWNWRTRPATDPRMTEAFVLAQRGENERAGELLEAYLGEHPDDGEALAMKLLTEWWQGVTTTETIQHALRVNTRPELRAMVHGVDLMEQKRRTEALAYLEQAAREFPDSIEVAYVLGEARFHDQHIEDGLAALELAFRRDPRWQMALHHVLEVHLARGEPDRLVSLAGLLRTVDPAAALVADCRIAIGRRDHAGAVKGAQAALAQGIALPELYVCLAQAQTLAGDHDAALTTAKRAFDLWPIDSREWGGFAAYAEQLLYRGKLDEYLELTRGKSTRQRTLALALWRPAAITTEPAPAFLRVPPLASAAWILAEQTLGHDHREYYATHPEVEVKLYGEALSAETQGDLVLAVTKYRQALAAPAKGDMRMLLAYHLARVLHVTGDDARAAEACKEVIVPLSYQSYRAILLPDCLLWTGDRASLQQLVGAWQGSFEHPAVVEARKRLAN